VRAGYVAEAGGELVGMIAVDDVGSIPLVMVHHEWQRRGIGRQLVEAALERLRKARVSVVGLGRGGAQHIWQGVPQDLPGAVAFFEQTGWAFEDVTVDMVRDLGDYETPHSVGERIEPLGLTIQKVAAGGRETVLEFEDRYFPGWSRRFREAGTEVLSATTARDGIVASLLFAGPGTASVFEPLLGVDMGTIACVGVAEAHRGRGIGTALVASASELLHDRGVRRCHVDWTVRERFYGRLGYLRWRSFLMCRRHLEQS
jgi:beta-N-acetylhexosaminidase